MNQSRLTSRDIARVAGVSQSTVSRVLSGNGSVKEDLRQRVLRALEETGYRPNVLARGMRTHSTMTVGVEVGPIANPFYPELLQTLELELRKVGYHMLLWSTSESEGDSKQPLAGYGLVDGLLFTTSTAGQSSLQDALLAGVPVVLVNRGVESLDCDQVMTDNLMGGRIAGEYLIAGGHRRIGLVRGDVRASTSTEREVGFREALAAGGVSLDAELCVDGAFDYGTAYQAVRDLLTRKTPPTALFCANDLMAFGALNAAKGLGVRVPEDLWVVGFDDFRMAGWELFDLTTVRQPIEEIARTAVRMLVERIRTPDREAVQMRFLSRLIVRGTTANFSVPELREK